MIQNESRVNIVDNSWGKQGKVVKVLKGGDAKFATVGDLVSVAVKKANPQGEVGEGDMATWLVVRTRKEINRNDGTYIRFEDNAVVLIDQFEMPVGKRIFGPIAKEVREKGYESVASLAKEIV